METLKSPTETKCIKECRCSFCGENIVIGEKYVKSTHKFDGQVYDWKAHKYCSQLASDLNMYDEADEGVTSDMFCESVNEYHDDVLIRLIPQEDAIKYRDIITQLRNVRFRDKMWYVIRHLNKLKESTTQPLNKDGKHHTKRTI